MVSFRMFRRFWSFTAIVVMLQMSVVQAMASSGELHNCLHDHEDEPSHECAVTLMLQGGYDKVVPDIIPVEIISESPDVPLLALKASDVEPSHLTGGVLAHAPPRGP
jgi:hypothetical protein